MFISIYTPYRCSRFLLAERLRIILGSVAAICANDRSGGLLGFCTGQDLTCGAGSFPRRGREMGLDRDGTSGLSRARRGPERVAFLAERRFCALALVEEQQLSQS